EEVVIGVVVVVDAAVAPEIVRAGEVAHLPAWCGDPGAGRGEASGAVALVAVEVGVQHPLDLLDPQPLDLFQNQATPAVDHNRAVAAANDVDVTNIVDLREARTDLVNRG